MAPALPQPATAADGAAAAAFFRERPAAAATFEQVRHYMGSLGPMGLAATKSRVAFVAGTRFLWVHQANLDGAITMGFLLPRRIDSPRLRSGRAGGRGDRWSHHVQLTRLDPQLKGWFREAYEVDRAAVRDAPAWPRSKAAAVPPRWVCPACGQEFLRKGQAHSCDRRAVEELFADFPKAIKVTQLVQAHIDQVAKLDGGEGRVRLAATKTQVSFAAARRFAFVWVPQQATGSGPSDPAVSFLLPRHEDGKRIWRAVQVRADLWQHHVLVKQPRQVDAQLKSWLAEAYETVGA